VLDVAQRDLMLSIFFIPSTKQYGKLGKFRKHERVYCCVCLLKIYFFSFFTIFVNLLEAYTFAPLLNKKYFRGDQGQCSNCVYLTITNCCKFKNSA